jgi:hypothetical protein
MKTIISRTIVAILLFGWIAFGQSSKTVVLSELIRVNMNFWDNGPSECYTMTENSIGELFVSGYDGATVAKFSLSGSLIWKNVFGSGSCIQHQMVFDLNDQTIIASCDNPNSLVKLDQKTGSIIWKSDTTECDALGIWDNHIVVYQEGLGTGYIWIFDESGNVENKFQVSGPIYPSGYPMIKIVGDAVYYFDDNFFGKYSLPDGKPYWTKSTKDFATRAVKTYGEVMSNGYCYVATSDLWDNAGGKMYYAVAKYDDQGNRIWKNNWYGRPDTATADGMQINNWTEGITYDSQHDLVILLGATQKGGTSGYQVNAQSSYLACLNANTGDTLKTSIWDDGEIDTLIATIWYDGHMGNINQLVLLGYSCFVSKPGSYGVTTIHNFVKEFSINDVLGVKDTKNSLSFELSQNYPNPFNPTTTINFSLAKASDVTLSVYNLLGQKVATVINKYLASGTHSYQFDGSKLASGVYVYRITAGNFTDTKKMVLLK